MSIVSRGERVYSYRSVRRDGRVTVEYCGAGEVALLMEREAKRLRDERRALHEARRRAVRRLIAGIGKVQREVAELSGRVDELFVEGMTARGFYRHKREWRRRKYMQASLPGPEEIAAERARRLFDQAGADTGALI